jgi:cytochrome c peroxidase
MGEPAVQLTSRIALPTRWPSALQSTAIDLGKQLFFDAGLSRDGTVSCATCHQPQRAFSDGRRVGVGIDGRPGTRNTPTLLDAASLPSLNWDGRRERLEDQVVDPLLHPIEHGCSTRRSCSVG